MLIPFDKPIFVTKPFLPPLEEYSQGLREIWDTGLLTNNGPILKRFSNDLSTFFNTDNVCLFNNGTLALQIALQGMGISGEVITTPFSFIATTHALFWNKIRPVFVDIEPDYYTIDPDKVEAAITPSTTAILAVHVYGHPCRLDVLADIARRNNIKLLYDAAHAFGIQVNTKSIANYGDLSMFSFHATKSFHTIEGGLLIFKDSRLKEIFDYLKNFGFKNEVEVVMPGTNAKMNEIQALMGILNLKYFEDCLIKRSRIYDLYHQRLRGMPGIHLPPELPPNINFNYIYMPIEVDEKEFGMSRDALYEALKKYNVYSRRYFYPLICDYECYRNVHINDPLTVARHIADRILTLPIYDSLDPLIVEMICDIILSIHNG
jgi:dTDP-4-amino-4,6-dideoxygalactose transaminase